jgi:hypothetical protein
MPIRMARSDLSCIKQITGIFNPGQTLKANRIMDERPKELTRDRGHNDTIKKPLRR